MDSWYNPFYMLTSPTFDWANLNLPTGDGSQSYGNETVAAVPYTEPASQNYGTETVAPAYDWSTAFGGVDANTWAQNYMAEQAAQQSQQALLDKYIADQAAQGKETVSLNPYNPGGDISEQINYAIHQGLNPVTAENLAAQTGQVFRFNTLKEDAGILGGSGSFYAPDASGNLVKRDPAAVVFQPGQTYTLTDYSGKNVLGTASTPEEMQALVDKSNAVPNFSLYGSGQYSTPGANATDASNLLFSSQQPDPTWAALGPLMAASMVAMGAAPALTGAGYGIPGAAATTGTTAVAPIATTATSTGATAAPVVATTAAPTVASTVPGWTVVGSAGGGLTAGQLAALAAPTFAGIGSAINAGVSSIPNSVSANAVDTGQVGTDGWTVSATAEPSPFVVDPAIAASVSAATQPATTTPAAATPSLLDQILKYGSLASLAANGLGSLFGGSGSAAAATTPYTSVLGAAPTFTRGAIQPYTGNYETYGQGPEWNFFAPQSNTGA